MKRIINQFSVNIININCGEFFFIKVNNKIGSQY